MLKHLLNILIYPRIFAYLKGFLFIMKAKKYKHLSFENRCVIEEFSNHSYNFTQISNRLGKHRIAISKEIPKHRFLRGSDFLKRPYV